MSPVNYPERYPGEDWQDIRDEVKVTVELDTELRVVAMPKDLAGALKKTGKPKSALANYRIPIKKNMWHGLKKPKRMRPASAELPKHS
jgi:hypothetical protein